MDESEDQFPTLESSLAEAIDGAKLQRKIEARARELYGLDGSDCGYSHEEARQLAAREVLGDSCVGEF